MYYKYISYTLLGLVLLQSSFFATAFPKQESLKETIERLYTGISGFGIDKAEEDAIINKGGFPTYGEITYESLDELLKDLKLSKEDIFYDLGSGVGKVVLQVFLDSQAAKCVGVELSPTRHAHAQRVKERLLKPNILERAKNTLRNAGFLQQQPQRTLEFHNQNIVDAPIQDATVVFMCSTCYSDELMKKITDKLSHLKKGLRVLTLKKLPDGTPLQLVKTYTLPMTWSNSTAIYLYELK